MTPTIAPSEHKIQSINTPWTSFPKDLITQIPENYQLRLLDSSDYHRGYLELLSQLTKVGSVSKDQFDRQFNLMTKVNRDSSSFIKKDEASLSSNWPTYNIYVLYDTTTNRIMATCSLIIELKFIHECSSVGHIEDVVVDGSLRGKGLGALMIKMGMEMAKRAGCYKITLDCSKDNEGFYVKTGMECKGLQMTKYFD